MPGNDENFTLMDGDGPSSVDFESWGSRLIQLPTYSFLCEVEQEFIEDNFNLTGLKSVLPQSHGVCMYREALNILLGSSGGTPEELAGAKILYGLIHARWIMSSKGMAAMVRIRHGLPSAIHAGAHTHSVTHARARRTHAHPPPPHLFLHPCWASGATV